MSLVRSKKKSDKSDTIQSFTMDGYPVRGWVIRLNTTYRSIISQRPYPNLLRQLMAESLVTSVVVSEMCVEPGTLMMEYTGTEGIDLLSVRCTQENEIRALIQTSKVIQSKTHLKSSLSEGLLTVTYHPRSKGESYINDIPIMDYSMLSSMTHFLENSERMPSQFKLAITPHSVVGLCLQYVPTFEYENSVDYEHVLCRAGAMKEEHLLQYNNATLLCKLFPEETICFDQTKKLCFKCDCSCQKMQDAMLDMGNANIAKILSDKEKIEITCDYCNKQYEFDRIDVQQLFKIGQRGGWSNIIH